MEDYMILERLIKLETIVKSLEVNLDYVKSDTTTDIELINLKVDEIKKDIENIKQEKNLLEQKTTETILDKHFNRLKYYFIFLIISIISTIFIITLI